MKATARRAIGNRSTLLGAALLFLLPACGGTGEDPERDTTQSSPDLVSLDETGAEDILGELGGEDSTEPEPLEASLEVSDQSLELSTLVLIDLVESESQTFVAIHEDNGNGEAGGVLGSLSLIAGVNREIVVAL